MKKSDLLKETIKHIDIKSFDSTQIINAMSGMFFVSGNGSEAFAHKTGLFATKFMVI